MILSELINPEERNNLITQRTLPFYSGQQMAVLEAARVNLAYFKGIKTQKVVRI